MMKGAALVLALLAPVSAVAFPDGAPWVLDPARGCTACHFGPEPERRPLGELVSATRSASPDGEAFDLEIDAGALGGAITGFLAGIGGTTVIASLAPGIEADGTLLRSTAARADGRWRVRIVPQEGGADMPARLVLWLNAADGDGSPFGDRIFRAEGALEPGSPEP